MAVQVGKNSVIFFMNPVNLADFCKQNLMYLNAPIYCFSALQKYNMPRKLFVVPEKVFCAPEFSILALKFFIFAPEFFTGCAKLFSMPRKLLCCPENLLESA